MFKKTSLKINKFKKIYLIISLCLFVWMFFSISIETGETTFLNKLMYRLSGTVFSFILLWGWSIPTYFIVKYIIKKNDANNFNHEIENKNYFRENLDDTPIFIISYLYNKNIDRKRDVPAHIMKLMVDGYIKEENGKYVVTNKDTSNLLYTDKTIINFIKNNYNKYMLDNYEDDVYMDVLEQGYVTEKNSFKSIIKLIVFLIIIGVILYSIFFYLLNKTSYINGVYNSFLNHNYTINTNKPGGIFILLLSFIINVYPMVSLISIIIYFNILKKIPSRKITDKGKMSLIKINGLKNFLEDFSNIDDSKLEELHLRDFYLPYSVILNINNKASKELIDKINNIIHID